MRNFASVVFGLLAVLLAAAAFCGAWLNTNVVSETGFAALGEPLAQDESLQGELATSLSGAVSVDVPAPLAGLVGPLITTAVEQVQSLPEYPEAWSETLRRSHALTFGNAAEGTGSAVTLDVAPLVGLVTGSVGGELGASVPAPEQVPVEIGGAGQADLISNVQRAGEAWPLLALAAAVAGLLALIAARRRSTTFAMLGLGVAVAGGVLWLGAGLVPVRLVAQQLGSPVASAFAEAFAGQAIGSLRSWTVGLILAGAAAFVVGMLARFLRGSRR
ncbi:MULTISPECIES: hypothetical protein [unclassified Arthrobacter]|uniref:hypothetical protein n=1 Tax=unclassified Arthrobacter TaxID=235627 RepID=UPI001E5E99A9|nr:MULTISPECIES: hypothetical protein [unclassified Arthrobacter]MCC9146348.1 hypothetical protein [Arthrobacter sp. zg-Y919]MDK1277578.1 hypothetical protein [Arthrobacter sp. zg.Y919]WIB02460.1 hypothetical protein QNO10_10880 [Arthrobacter sp. zg-Y919]